MSAVTFFSKPVHDGPAALPPAAGADPLARALAAARTAAADPALWSPHLRFDAGRRHWARLPGPAGVDLWLLTWLPGQETELHDHGLASAAIVVLDGALDELRVDPAGGLSSVVLRPGSTRSVRPGVIHDVVNTSAETAVSIHAYCPRLTAMTYWSVQEGGLRAGRTVLTDCPEQ